WSDTVKRSILLDSKADLVVFGMGESAIVDIARRLDAGETLHDLRDMRGVAYALGAAESKVQSSKFEVQRNGERKDSLCAVPLSRGDKGGWGPPRPPPLPRGDKGGFNGQWAMGNGQFEDRVILPSFAQIRDEKLVFAEAPRLIHLETNPY